MAKKPSEEVIQKFRRDYERLRKKLGVKGMAPKMVMSEANLSRLGAGSKSPGQGFLKKFYTVFGEELKKLGYDMEGPVSSQVEEAQVAYLSSGGKDVIDLLKQQNDRILSTMDKITETHQSLAVSHQFLNASHKDASEINLILARTNEKLINKLGL